MPANTTAAERETYDALWTHVDAYQAYAPGEQYASVFADLVGPRRHRGTVLDAGCGSGKGGLALARLGFEVSLLDLTPAGLVPEAQALPFIPGCLWAPVWRHFDWVYCTDVLEHLPTQFTMLAVRNLLECAAQGVFLSVALVPDQCGVWVGKPLHQTVETFTWWRDSLRELGTVVDARDLMANALFLVKP